MLSDYHIITNILPVELPKGPTYSYTFQTSFWNNKSARALAVQAFRLSKNGVGIAIVASANSYFKTVIAIHSKNGTGEIEYRDPALDKGDALIHHINEFEGAPSGFVSGDGLFKAYSDPVLTDLIYGPAVMHTNVDDTQILYKDFALLSCQFSLRTYEKAKDTLGYCPIVELSAIDKRGIELDFITLNEKLMKVKDYGFFLMKTTDFRQKLNVLRQRFLRQKITFIVNREDYSAQRLEEGWAKSDNVDFILA